MEVQKDNFELKDYYTVSERGNLEGTYSELIDNCGVLWVKSIHEVTGWLIIRAPWADSDMIDGWAQDEAHWKRKAELEGGTHEEEPMPPYGSNGHTFYKWEHVDLEEWLKENGYIHGERREAHGYCWICGSTFWESFEEAHTMPANGEDICESCCVWCDEEKDE